MDTSSPVETLSTIQTPSLDDLITIEGLLQEYPDLFAETQLRWALRTRKQNGLDEHVFKFGKSLYLSRSGFALWMQSRRGL